MSEEKKITEDLTDSDLDEVVGGSGMYYCVEKGDLLSDIAKRYSVSVSQLMSWNHLTNPLYISVGQRLRVR